MTMSRRQFVASLAAAPILANSSSLMAFGGDSIASIGVQLYTVRDHMAKDASGTLAAVAEAGYKEVETAGHAGLSLADFKSALKAAGLKAPSAHVPINEVQNNPEGILETAEVLGHDYVVVPWLAQDMRNLKGYGTLIDALNKFGEDCAKAGVQLAYHNHEFEFENIDGTVPYDLMLKECDEKLVQFELDLFWAEKAGVDSSAYFKAHPGRFPMCHVKDMTPAGDMVAVGDGAIDFASLFASGRTGGLKHYFVEHDRPQDSMASIRKSIKAVRKIQF